MNEKIPTGAPRYSGTRSVARKLALQALYRWQLNAAPWQDLVQEFGDAEDMARADREYFRVLVEGVWRAREDLDLRLATLGDREPRLLDPIEHAVLPWCEKHGVAVVGYSPFGHGSFPGPRTRGGQVLREIAGAHGATPRQVALRFLVRRPSLFTIPKAANTDHVTENAGTGDLQLTEAELARIDEVFPLGARPRVLPTL